MPRPAARPLIAISSRPRNPGEVQAWPDASATVMQNVYLDALWRSGADEAIVAPRSISVDDAKQYLERMDGLVLVGGGDVDPQRFGQIAHPRTYGVVDTSDDLEMSLMLAALELGLPTLAICRGLQVLNVALGGSLHQHITDGPGFQHHGQPGEGHVRHSVEVEAGSLLAKTQGGAARIESCWSYHHQAADQLGTGLVVSARSDDGTVEALELEEAESKGWMVAVQWHPERTAANDPAQQVLFDELSRQALDYAANR